MSTQPEIIQTIGREGQKYVDTLVFNNPINVNLRLFRAVARASGRVIRVLEACNGPAIIYKEVLFGEQPPKKIFRHIERDYMRWKKRDESGALVDV